MDPLTPNKIQKLLKFAEDASAFSNPRRIPVAITIEEPLCSEEQATVDMIQFQSGPTYESSSGIIDLEQVRGFGETETNDSFSRSAASFNPGEITGRSTGATELSRHSLGNNCLGTIEANMNKQSNEIQDIMRHSIAADYSFHSKRDLTADEASLIQREAPLPIQGTNQSYFMENMSYRVSKSNVSVGTYFNNRCESFRQILGVSDSPRKSAKDDSASPSITEVSSNPLEPISFDMNKYKLDETLDSVPVRQPRVENLNNAKPVKNYEKATLRPIQNDTYNRSEMSIASVATPELPKLPKNFNPTGSQFAHKPHCSSKPANILLRKMHTSYRNTLEDTEVTQGSLENSLSLSKIAEFLGGKQSNISVSEILRLGNNKPNMPVPNNQELINQATNAEAEQPHKDSVANLRESRNLDVASSAGTLNTVISVDKLKINEPNIPSVIVTEFDENKRSTRSKSPSSKSHSTMSTVQEIHNSFKSGGSPIRTSGGQINTSHVCSPNIEYRELDKSVDWQEVLRQKRSFATEKWADISASPAHGFVGVSCAVAITVTTLTDSWLTAKFNFEVSDDCDLTIELPRQPLLLSPGKTEQYTIYITANDEATSTLPFTMYLKDASLDREIEQKVNLEMNIKMPVIQAMSSDGINKVTFSGVPVNTTVVKSFVLISDCPCDLQLDLSIFEGDNAFSIRNVQEIKKTDVSKVLIERQGSTEDPSSKGKSKGMNKQLCRLSNGNAIRVSISFCPPRIFPQKVETFTGALYVNLIGMETVLRKVELIGSVGTVNLVIKMPPNKLHLTSKPTNLTLCNTGTIPGIWYAKFMNNDAPFQVTPSKIEIRPSALRVISLTYVGPEDSATETTIYFEDLNSGIKTGIEVTGGEDKPKTFPIRTNHNIISWVRNGRKELSLKNSTDKKVHIRCQIQGDGFTIDVPGVESRDAFCMTFCPGECRPLPIMFAPNSFVPFAAILFLTVDKNNNLSRNIKLFGCSSGDTVRWHGPVTYGETALVRCEAREQIALQLYNRSHAPAFVSAQVHFNLQYNSIASTAQLLGNNTIIPARSKHLLRLCVDWARVERRARDAGTSALAAVTCLTGAEITRRRILRVLRDDASRELDTSLLDNHLKALAGQFEREDPGMDHMLTEFKETKASLNELIGGLHELTAQIVLPQDFMDENTIIITDDTMVEYHTLCE